VFNALTHQVEGILYRGQEDFSLEMRYLFFSQGGKNRATIYRFGGETSLYMSCVKKYWDSPPQLQPDSSSITKSIPIIPETIPKVDNNNNNVGNEVKEEKKENQTSTGTSNKNADTKEGNQMKVDEDEWNELLYKMQDALYDVIDTLKIQMSPTVKQYEWEDWKGATAIPQFLNAQRRKRGGEGLKKFKEVLNKMQYYECIRNIENSQCAFLFQ